MSANFPRGAGLGRDSNPRNPSLIDFDWTAQNGSRAQRREIVRQLKTFKRKGLPGAAEALVDLEATDLRARRKSWRVSLPGRTPFNVICPQHASADEIRSQWPGAELESLDGQ